MPYPEKKVDPKDIVTEKTTSKSGGPNGSAGASESNMPDGAMPDAPTKYEYAPDPQGPDAEKA